jgi:hypothetical protein
MNYNYMWIPRGADAPIKSKQTIAIQKRMVTVSWSPLGFPVLKILPKEQHFDDQYSTSTILSLIAESRPTQTRKIRAEK